MKEMLEAAPVISEVEGEVKRVARGRVLCAVVLTSGGPVQLEPLAQLVAKLRGCDVAEGARRIRSGGGFILRDATPAEIETVGEELWRQDLPFILIPTAELPEPGDITPLRKIGASSKRIELETSEGSTLELQWQDVLAITCAKLQAQERESMPAASRLVLSVFTRQPLACYQLNHNLEVSFSPGGSALGFREFEQVARSTYKHFRRSAQNKGMQVVSKRGAGGKMKGLTFNRRAQLNAYNYWVALLRMYQLDLKGGMKAKFSLSQLLGIEFETEPGAEQTLTRRRPARFEPNAQRVRGVLQAPEPPAWFYGPASYVDARGIGLKIATFIAAVCLAIYVFLEVLG